MKPIKEKRRNENDMFGDVFEVLNDAISAGLKISADMQKRNDLVEEIITENYLYNLPNKDLEEMVETGRTIKKIRNENN